MLGDALDVIGLERFLGGESARWCSLDSRLPWIRWMGNGSGRHWVQTWNLGSMSLYMYFGWETDSFPNRITIYFHKIISDERKL